MNGNGKQRDRAEASTQRAHDLAHSVRRDKPHKAVRKRRQRAKKAASRASRRVDRAIVRDEVK